jgi:hypothetical protein
MFLPSSFNFLPFFRKSLISMLIPDNSGFFCAKKQRASGQPQRMKCLEKTKPECISIQPNSGGFK